MSILKEPIATEKTIRQIELENKITFIVDRKATKKEIKEQVEKMFKVKVLKINIQVIKNQKVAHIKLKQENPAIDIATKLGII